MKSRYSNIINQSVIRLVDTIVDTRAKFTCYRARLIDSSLTKEQMIRNFHKDIGGLVGFMVLIVWEMFEGKGIA